MVKAQEYVNKNCKDKTIKELYISRKGLEGHLDLGSFVNLEKLDCSHNSITNLNLANCPVIEIDCSNNNLTGLVFLSALDKKRVEFISLQSNKFISQDLSIFSRFVNLRTLRIGNKEKDKIEKSVYNGFHGSLIYLKNLEKLEELDISSTDVDSGLEYLPNGIKKLYIFAEKDSIFKIKEIVIELEKLGKPTGGSFSLSPPNFASLLVIWKGYKTNSLVKLVDQLKEEIVQQQKKIGDKETKLKELRGENKKIIRDLQNELNYDSLQISEEEKFKLEETTKIYNKIIKKIVLVDELETNLDQTLKEKKELENKIRVLEEQLKKDETKNNSLEKNLKLEIKERKKLEVRIEEIQEEYGKRIEELKNEVENAHLNPEAVDNCALFYKEVMLNWFKKDLDEAKDKITNLSFFNLNSLHDRLGNLEQLINQNKETKFDSRWQNLFVALENCWETLKKLFSDRLEVGKNNSQLGGDWRKLEDELKKIIKEDKFRLKNQNNQLKEKINHLQDSLEKRFQEHLKLFNDYVDDKKKQFDDLFEEVDDKLKSDLEGKKIFYAWKKSEDDLVEIFKGRGVGESKRQQLQDVKDKLKQLEVELKQLKDTNFVGVELIKQLERRDIFKLQIENMINQKEHELNNLLSDVKENIDEDSRFLLEMMLETQNQVSTPGNDTFAQNHLQKLKKILSEDLIVSEKVEDICFKQKVITQLKAVVKTLLEFPQTKTSIQEYQTQIIQINPKK